MEEKIIIFLLLISSFMVLASLVVIYRKKDAPGAVYFILSLVATLMWINGYLIEVLGQSLNVKFIGAKIQYFFGIPFLPVFWYAAVKNFTTYKKEPSRWEIAVLSIVPFITMSLIFTNTSHELMYKNMEIGILGEITFIKKEIGLWYYMHLAFSYFIISIGIYKIYRFSRKNFGIYRKQAFYLLFVMLCPLLATLIYVFEIIPGVIDITPISFAFAAVVGGINIYKFKMFDLIPAARDTIIESLNNGILVLNSDNRIIDANMAAIKMFNDKKLIGKLKDDVLRDTNIQWDVDTSKETEIFELDITGNNYELVISTITNSDKQENGQIYTFYDITERKINEDNLRKLNMAKDKLFSIIAHDLKNPFVGLIGLSEMLYSDYDEFSDEEKKDLIKDLNDLSKNTHSMLENLLNWSRQQSGSIDFLPSSFNINKLIIKNVNNAAQQAAIKRIKVFSKITEIENELNVYADLHMIDTVIRNLISNAIKFTKPGGVIEIFSEQNEKHIKVFIKDNGVGIPDKAKNGLFNLGNNVKSVGTTGEKGTGLGLVLCKEFIEKNNGEIMVESVEDIGSTFIFTLPFK